MISDKKLTANRKNGILGGSAWKEMRKKAYELNPSFCQTCQSQLPQKKKGNKFCNRSCAATFNNTGKIRRKHQLPFCKVCGTTCKYHQAVYCSMSCCAIGQRKYTPEEKTIIVRKQSREISAHYRAKVREQTPLTADREAIKLFYSNCPEGYEVDHIIPISKGGLHTLENLQYLTVSENRRKSNKIL